MLIQCTNNQGNTIVQFESSETRNIATNQAIDKCYALSTSFFAVYVDGVLDCFSESSDRFQFPKTI
jgi:hypothetical protein